MTGRGLIGKITRWGMGLGLIMLCGWAYFRFARSEKKQAME
jgi:hypothetical protein